MRQQWFSALSLLTLALTGCGLGSNSTATTATSLAVVYPPPTGSVHGGQQPVTGSTIQLYAVGTGGYGSTPTALLSSSVISSDGTGVGGNASNGFNTYAPGAFSITGLYTCPGANPQVYLTATGGNPGLSAGTNNSAIFLVAALSDCNALKNNAATTHLNINEVTTVATAYAMSQFADPSTGNMGSYSYSTQGLNNAVATVGNMVNTSTGVARFNTINGNGVVPQQEINTLADILTPCVNTNLPSSSACTASFAAAKPPTGSTPANAFAAAIDIALNPSNNVATLYGLSLANAPFQPVLAGAPNDWTMALSYSGSAGGGQDLAIDALGGIWIADNAGGGNTSSLSRFNNQGAKTFTVGGGSGNPAGHSAYGIAVDLSGNGWVANDDPTSPGITEVNSSGNSIAGPFTFPETNQPEGIAVDGNNNIWITNSGDNSVTEMTQSNGFQNLSPNNSGFTGGGLSGPLNIAIDAEGDAWVSNYNNATGNSITEITPAQTLTQFTGGGLQAPAGIAVDANDNVWVTNYFNGSTTVSAFNHNGTPLASGGFTGGGIHNPIAVAIDGASNVWIANESSSANSISELNSSGQPLSPATTGYQGGQVGNLKFPWTIKVDSSGNIWVTNYSSTPINTTNGTAGATITEFVGLASPAITPLASAVSSGQIGKLPGTPIPVYFQSTTLPYYSSGVNYFGRLVAGGGNTGTYTFTLNSGSLPTGFALAASGAITGSSTVTGTTTFQVKVADNGNPNNFVVQSVSMTASNSLPLGGGESMLNGRYIMRLGGFNNYTVPNSGSVNGYSVLQSMVFDGAGHISAVSEDFNNPSSHSSLASGSAGTGYYTLGTDHRGIMVFNYSGITLEYAFSVGNLNGSSIAQDMHVIEFDNNKPSGSHPYGTAAGLAKLQTTTSLTTNQAYVFGVTGETPCTLFNANGCPNGVVHPYGAVAAVGRFFVTNSNTITGGVEDAGANNTSYNGVTFTGTFTSPDANGRGTLTLTTVGTLFPNAPSNYIYYVVSPTELYILSIDPHSNYAMLIGDVLAQTTTFTSATTLTGNFVGYESSPNGGDGNDFYPNQSGASIIYLETAVGSQNLSVVVEEAGGGQLKLAKQQGTLGYAVDSNGRLTLSAGGGNVPVFYFASTTQGFGVEQPDASNGGDTGLIFFEQQSAGPFSCSDATGTLFFGDVQPPVPFGVSSGSVLENGTGTGAITVDNSDPSGVLTFGQTESISCTAADIPDPNGTHGRFTYTTPQSSSVGYAVSPTKLVLMNTDPGDNTPAVIIIQK
ncbi:MAG: NHL repeat-containing protein [Acidobacteriota bacterium]